MVPGYWQLLSKVSLSAALGLFIAFHFLHGFGNPEQGWTVWKDIADLFRDSWEQLGEPQLAIVVASFLMFSLLLVTSPFLGAVWRKSLLAWSVATASSGLAALGFWTMILVIAPTTYGSGGICLMLAPLLNFAGLMLARAGEPHESE